ncbi:50S ribosomal protein L6 [bacterium]|nr:50S ribosomal protein L6 [bacterium]
MSRIGKKPILIPSGVDVIVDGQNVTVKGPKGTLTRTVHAHVTVSVEDMDGAKAVAITVKNGDAVGDRAQWGTARANLANLVRGVTEGFSRSLEVNGVGFRVAVQGKNVAMNLGFSHDVNFALPEGVTATVDKNILTIVGMDREVVGQTAARIRKLKVPEPYKGKGIKYTDEVVRRKAGKAAKAGE